MKTLLVLGLSGLILSTDVEASLGHPGQEVQQDIPIELDELVLELLQRDPSDRPASARVVFERLEKLLRGPLPRWPSQAEVVERGNDPGEVRMVHSQFFEVTTGRIPNDPP